MRFRFVRDVEKIKCTKSDASDGEGGEATVAKIPRKLIADSPRAKDEDLFV